MTILDQYIHYKNNHKTMYNIVKFEKCLRIEDQQLLNTRNYLLVDDDKLKFKKEILNNDQKYILIKKLDLDFSSDLKKFIYTFIYINGYKLNVLKDIILICNKRIEYKKNCNKKDKYGNPRFSIEDKLKMKIHSMFDVEREYFKIVDNIKNKTNKEELNYYKQSNIYQENFIINYDMLENDKDFAKTENISDYLKKLRLLKARLSHTSNTYQTNNKILNFAKENLNWSVEDIAINFGVCNKLVFDLLKENNIILSLQDKNLKKIKIEIEVMKLRGVGCSIIYLNEKTGIAINTVKKIVKENNFDIINHTQFKSNMQELINENQKNSISKTTIEKLKNDIEEIDITNVDFWDSKSDGLEDMFVLYIDSNEVKKIEDEWNNCIKECESKITELTCEDIIKLVNEKFKKISKESYSRITKESSLKLLNELQRISESNNILYENKKQKIFSDELIINESVEVEVEVEEEIVIQDFWS